MKLFDETILTAYLDGELDEPRRRQVEAALTLSPRLSARLAELARTRSLVADLRRPKAPSALAAGVVAELQARRGRRRFPLRLDGPSRTALNAVAALAAAVVVAVTLAPWRRAAVPLRPGNDAIARHGGPVVPGPEAAGVEAKGVDLRPGLRALGQWLVAALKKAAEAPDGPTEAERRLDRQRQALEAMLDRRVARYSIPVDPARFVEAQARLRALVDGTRLTRPARAHMDLDGDGKGGRAVVFAMVMRGAERDRFVETLQATFAEVAEDRPPATLLTRLAEPRRFDLHDGPAMSPVSTDPDLNRSRPGMPLAAKPKPPEPPFRVPPTPDPLRFGPPAPLEADPADAPATDDATTVLIWLTARPPQRASK
ncbi:MAG TPA: zf-HC2 domain-containing protein [Isosphaeraceae bacterium]|jgi:hypothetical protein|nr:zf-HC2 domain-containing protein [Isosphaeraceae bacterium]